jgi:hypothetical protein
MTAKEYNREIGDYKKGPLGPEGVLPLDDEGDREFYFYVAVFKGLLWRFDRAS